MVHVLCNVSLPPQGLAVYLPLKDFCAGGSGGWGRGAEIVLLISVSQNFSLFCIS